MFKIVFLVIRWHKMANAPQLGIKSLWALYHLHQVDLRTVLLGQKLTLSFRTLRNFTET